MATARRDITRSSRSLNRNVSAISSAKQPGLGEDRADFAMSHVRGLGDGMETSKQMLLEVQNSLIALDRRVTDLEQGVLADILARVTLLESL